MRPVIGIRLGHSPLKMMHRDFMQMLHIYGDGTALSQQGRRVESTGGGLDWIKNLPANDKDLTWASDDIIKRQRPQMAHLGEKCKTFCHSSHHVYSVQKGLRGSKFRNRQSPGEPLGEPGRAGSPALSNGGQHSSKFP